MSIHLKITKSRLAAAVAAGVVLAPATAWAAHVFDDVPDDAFYAEPVEWAFDNGITTGKSPTLFAPLDPVTRGESVTFLQRYHENVAAPGQGRVAGARVDDSVNDWDGLAETLGTSITAPTDGYLLIDYSVTVTKDNDETAVGEMILGSVLDVDGETVGVSNGGIDFDESWQSNFNTVRINTVVPVTAGEHAVSGVISRVGAVPAGALMFIYDQSLTALFVPFDGAGNGPT